jgi:hypothetical protein
VSSTTKDFETTIEKLHGGVKRMAAAEEGVKFLIQAVLPTLRPPFSKTYRTLDGYTSSFSMNQTSLDMASTWTLIIEDGIRKLQFHLV